MYDHSGFCSENLQACLGRACTSIVTEFRHSRSSDNAPYVAEIECLTIHEIEDLLRTLVRDFRRYHLRAENQCDNAEELVLETNARLAWDTLKEVFENQADLTEEFLARGDRSSDREVEDRVIEWNDELLMPDDFNIDGTEMITAATADECSERLSELLEMNLWPFIKVMRYDSSVHR
jgi:hypothetical protein